MPTAIIQIIKYVVIAGIIFGIIYLGRYWERSIWQPVYSTLAEQMATMQSDINLKTSEAVGLANLINANLATMAKDEEVKNAKMDAEVDRRVDAYLNELARMRSVSEKADSGGHKGGAASSLSGSAGRSLDRGGKSGLFAALDRVERGIVQRLIRSRDHAITRNIKNRNYLVRVKAEMADLKKKYKLAIQPQPD